MTLEQENELFERAITESQANIKKVNKFVRTFGSKRATEKLFAHFLTLKPATVAAIAANLAVIAAQQQQHSEGGFAE